MSRNAQCDWLLDMEQDSSSTLEIEQKRTVKLPCVRLLSVFEGVLHLWHGFIVNWNGTR